MLNTIKKFDSNLGKSASYKLLNNTLDKILIISTLILILRLTLGI